jgi:hypothetical protein
LPYFSIRGVSEILQLLFKPGEIKLTHLCAPIIRERQTERGYEDGGSGGCGRGRRAESFEHRSRERRRPEISAAAAAAAAAAEPHEAEADWHGAAASRRWDCWRFQQDLHGASGPAYHPLPGPFFPLSVSDL